MKIVLKWFLKFYKKLDKKLLLPVILCAGFSILLLYSIYENNILSNVGARYYKIQIIAAILGLGISLLLSMIDYHVLAKIWFLYTPVCVFLVLLTFTSLGILREGSDDKAWLNLGAITIQPSEFLKLAFILTFSHHLSKVQESLNKPLHLFLLIIHGAVPTLLVAAQGDDGTAIVFVAMFVIMIFSAGLSWKYITAVLIASPVAVYVLWNHFLSNMQKNRILILIHPGSDPLGMEWQQDLGKAALSSGQLLGQGLFGGKYVAVPEMHNDFIFAHIGQTTGFVGSLLVVAVLTYICIKIIANSRIAKDNLGKYICIGAFALIFTHCFLNIGMVLVVLPVIGVPLPFLSGGGTAMLSMFTAIGLVMSTYAYSEKKQNVFYDSD
ncbi:MAG: FtsW/RodA/SpoVE family cell cycle protein [Clostridiales bacterium]|mgnify:CR=1 FL=1|nr:FtsW/RodA/SpoVE family cell cycle protein [Clostridiales bacterium]